MITPQVTTDKVEKINGVDVIENRDKYYAVLFRKTGNQETTTICPFCNTTHIHGIGQGHRVAHCAGDMRNSINLKLNDSVTLSNRDGYFLFNI